MSLAKLNRINVFKAEVEVLRFEEQWGLNKLKNVPYTHWFLYKGYYQDLNDYNEIVNAFAHLLKKKGYAVTKHDIMKDTWIIFYIEKAAESKKTPLHDKDPYNL